MIKWDEATIVAFRKLELACRAICKADTGREMKKSLMGYGDEIIYGGYDITLDYYDLNGQISEIRVDGETVYTYDEDFITDVPDLNKIIEIICQRADELGINWKG